MSSEQAPTQYQETVMRAALMQSMSSLLDPKAIAVVGASQRRSRGTSVMTNLRDCGFKGEIFAVNPRYQEILGYKCVASVSDLPPQVECLVVAIGADAACDVLEEAYAHGIRAAVVLAAGFGEGGHGEGRAARLRALAAKGMCICGPNCFGLINLKSGVASFSGPIPRPLRPGPVALVSQSGGLGATVFMPLMGERELGFSYFVSCGNQIGTTLEDYVEYFLHDDDISVIAIVAEGFKHPRRLVELAREANAQRKTVVLFQAGRTAAGQVLTRSHTGALAGNSEVLAAFMRHCGIVQADTFDEFVELVELFGIAPRDDTIGPEVIVVSGSGGGAAVAADVLADNGVALAPLQPSTKDEILAVMPEFGSVTNPFDGTGAIYDDPALLPKLFDILLRDPGRPVVAASVNARPIGTESTRRLANAIADAASASKRTFVAYQYSPLGGPLDAEILKVLHSAHIPFLLGTSNAMRVLKYLPRRREYWARAARADANRNADRGKAPSSVTAAGDPAHWNFLTARQALADCGVAVADAGLANSEAEAVALQQRFGTAVAIKAEVPGLLHKSDIGCVKLGCDGEGAVAQAYREVIQNARRAGFKNAAHVLVQPMATGIAEAYAGIIDDPLFGPAICFGLGGIFVEIFKDATTEMAPLSHDDAMRMIHRLKAASILAGARGRQHGDVEALANLLVGLGRFAVANAGRFRALDLNPIIVKAAGEGVVAVDVAIEPNPADAPDVMAHAAS
jgi:acetyltransferase